MKFHCHIINGKIEFTGKRTWVDSRIKLLPDGEYSLEINKYRKPRTSPMNRYFHGVLVPSFKDALNEAGWDEVRTDAQAKEIIKAMFLKASIAHPETGELIEYVKDTRDLTIEEMQRLWEDVWKWTAENLNYIILEPGQ